MGELLAAAERRLAGFGGQPEPEPVRCGGGTPARPAMAVAAMTDGRATRRPSSSLSEKDRR